MNRIGHTALCCEGRLLRAYARQLAGVFAFQYDREQRGCDLIAITRRVTSCEAELIRTPNEFRNIYDEWKKTVPANDSDIVPDKPKESRSPRHAGLCEQLKPLLAWRARYESTDPLQTNFLQRGKFDVIFNLDGSKDTVKLDTEGDLKEQSELEILKAVADVVFKKSYDNVVCYNENGLMFTRLRERLIPDLDAPQNKEEIKCLHNGKIVQRSRVEFGEDYGSKLFGQKSEKLNSITRLGRMTLSDTDLDSARPLGSVMSFSPGRFGKPIVRRMAKKPSGSYQMSSEVQRFDPCERLIKMEEGIATNDNLDPKHVRVLDVAIISPNFEAVGMHFGFTGKTAERQGKRLTLAACKAYSEILKKFSA